MVVGSNPTGPMHFKRFRKTNRKKPYEKKIKPFNFFLVGISNKDDIKPISPYFNNPQEVVYKKFIDYESGKVLKGIEYWKPLSDTLWEYINHKESKLDGDRSILKRKHVFVDGVIYIGKETNRIEETGIVYLPSYTVYINQEELKKRILSLTPKEARMIGLDAETLRLVKKKIRRKSVVTVRNKTLMRLDEV